MQLSVIKKLGIIAGAGSLPKHVMDACKARNVEYHVIGLVHETDMDLFEGDAHLSKFKVYAVSKILQKLKDEGITHLTLAGKVKRADLARLLLDMKGAKLLALILKAGLADNCILKTIMDFLEKEGFEIVAPEEIATEIVLQKGCITKIKPDTTASADIKKGLKILNGVASFDVGQSLVIQNGLVLGIEAAEGTDELIKRCGEIKQQSEEAPILLKIAKPHQDRRVDLPCIGTETVEMAHHYGIRGIAAEAGSALVIEQAKTIKLADKYKIFIVGI